MSAREESKKIFHGSQSELYVNATINYVDTERNVLDAISDDGMRFFSKCQYLSVNPDGSGSIDHPSAGNTCVIKVQSDGSCYVEKIYNLCAVDENGVPVRNLGRNAKFMPGDKVWLAKGGAMLALLRNGLVKIGVSPLCQMIFMKLESYTRWVSRNIEVNASGFRFYSVNDKGTNVTRLSIFLEDAMSKELRDKSSECSDFEFVVKDKAITLMAGPKDANGLRINRTMISLLQDGSLTLYQADKDSKPTQRVRYTPDGSSEHLVYQPDRTPIYKKTVLRNPLNQKPFVMVKEEVNGSYDLTVENGSFNLTTSEDILLHSKNFKSFAELTHAVESTATVNNVKIQA